MKTSPVPHSSWNSVWQSFTCPGILLLFSFNLVIGDSCYHHSTTAIKKVNGQDTTYVDSVGHPLELFCTFNPSPYTKNLTSKNLLFQKGYDLVDKKDISIVNETTISLKLENEKPSSNMYYCYLRMTNESAGEIDSGSSDGQVWRKNTSFDKDTICWSIVEIHGAPKEVHNISCTIYNWQGLNCRWQVPQNDDPTNYTIRYEVADAESKVFPCPNDDDVHDNTCEWTLSTEPPYQKDAEKLKITVTGVNVYNQTKETSFEFDHLSIVRVKGPESLRLAGKTETSIKLEWSIGHIRYFSKPWSYRIRYKTLHSDWSKWLVLDSANVTRKGGKVSYNVTNLTNNTMYDFQVFMKSQSANDNYWSNGFAGNVFRTKNW